MTALSVLIPSRNEEFLERTITGVLQASEADTEVIVVLDGEWSVTPLQQHPRVTIVYLPESIGQRAASNLAAKLSKAKYIMKLDAHCILDQGFDRKLIEAHEPGMTQIPRLYNLHAFNWKCKECGDETYQGPMPKKCHAPDWEAIDKAEEKVKVGVEDKKNLPDKYSANCPGKDFERVIVWAPRDGKAVPERRVSDFWRFDHTLHFQYWREFGKRAEGKGDICDVMGNLGACWFMERDRYWEIDGLDEDHGSWGQMGVEISCKTWLSGGRQVVNKNTWFSHLFRTQGGTFGFPYPQSAKAVGEAREHSKKLWMENTWDKQVHRLPWMINKFKPPEWDTKGIIYYTDSRLDRRIANVARGQIDKAEIPVRSVSLEPLNWGRNIHLDLKPGYVTMAKQILAGLEASTADVVFFCEHDVLYDPSHFDFIPERDDVYYYNLNAWKVDVTGEHKPLHYDCKQLSGLCANREFLIAHYKERLRRYEETGYKFRMGHEPGTHNREERIDKFGSATWRSPVPNVDLRHAQNLTNTRWNKDEFRNAISCRNWERADEVPGWGPIEQYLPNLEGR